MSDDTEINGRFEAFSQEHGEVATLTVPLGIGAPAVYLSMEHDEDGITFVSKSSNLVEPKELREYLQVFVELLDEVIANQGGGGDDAEDQ